MAEIQEITSNGKVAEYATVLGLTGRITFADVKDAYRREMLKWHPDRHYGRDTVSLANRRAQAINEAYEFLSEITEAESLPTVESQKAGAYDQYRTRHTYQQQTFKPGFPDPDVFEVFVKSSWIISVGYDQKSRTMYLKLARSVIYRCIDVPQTVFDNLLKAESVGRFVNQNVFSKFRHSAC